MEWTPIIIAIIGALGAGGLGAAIVNGLFNRPKLISEIYEKRMEALTSRATSLESRVEKLEGIIDTLKFEIEERDDMIDTLQRENAELKKQVAELQAENDCKEHKIIVLQKQVKELTARLDEYCKGEA